MKIFRSVKEWLDYRKVSAQNVLGFVPTMGALHEGHLFLVHQAHKECEKVLVSIFVNPTQFTNAEDLDRYPRCVARDLDLLKTVGVSYVLLPEYNEIYADDFSYQVSETKTSESLLCGKSRPGHFTGVLTVVMKLLQIAKAQKAYFGEKDFQQLELIRGLVKAFFLSTEIVGVPTVRDSEGLALSSRNLRLSEEGLKKARVFAKILSQSNSLEDVEKEIMNNKIDIDYLEERQGRRFAAVNIDGVRLIDNVLIIGNINVKDIHSGNIDQNESDPLVEEFI